MLSPATLVTDYVALAGVGAAFLNAALVLLIGIGLLMLTGDVPSGFTFAEAGLLFGFALFGKNIANIWPIILGGWLYSLVRKEPFSKYSGATLLGTALSPLVSFLCLRAPSVGGIAIGVGVGILIGFCLPSLSAYTFKIQNGMNLYNMGFACGLLGMVILPVCRRLGAEPEAAAIWSADHQLMLALFTGIFCLALILLGTFACNSRPGEAWRRYFRLLKTSGRAPSDYLRMFSEAPVLINMGICGLLTTGVLLLFGGQLNGATLGAIFSVIGFCGYGKHAFNILPIMAGVLIGNFLLGDRFQTPGMQLALLFGTCLAPISGYFGWPFGILAGFLHSAVVSFAGAPVMGVNLYNNGFCAGLLSVVLYPILTAVVRHRKPVLQDEEYADVFDGQRPVAPTTAGTPEEPADSAD